MKFFLRHKSRITDIICGSVFAVLLYFVVELAAYTGTAQALGDMTIFLKNNVCI